MAYCSTGYLSPVLQSQCTEGNGFLFAARALYMICVPAPKPRQGTGHGGQRAGGSRFVLTPRRPLLPHLGTISTLTTTSIRYL